MSNLNECFDLFPYPPYDIQKEFVNKLNSFLLSTSSDETLAPILLMESPTGTGKTTSLLCSSIPWLMSTNDHHNTKSSTKLPSWIQEAKEERLAKIPKISSCHRRRIIYTSRTHSQLEQVLEELKTITKLGFQNLKAIHLGSRRDRRCVNPSVMEITSSLRQSEACTSLLKENSCSFHPLDGREERMANAIASSPSIVDIESLLSKGREMCICPYYLGREMIGGAQIILLPYSSLLQREVRDGLGLGSMKNDLLIFDEGHNVIPTINGMMLVEVFEGNLIKLSSSLREYKGKYRHSPRNDGMLSNLLNIIEKISSLLQRISQEDSVMEVENFTISNGLESYNLLALTEWAFENNLDKKMKGFSKDAEVKATNSNSNSNSNTIDIIMTDFLYFLKRLSSPSNDGRILIGNGKIKYICIDPSLTFKEIREEVGKIVIAGGTLGPLSSFKCDLLDNKGCIETFSCDHIIPSTSIRCLPFSSGPMGKTFHFTKKDINDGMWNDLIMLLCNVERQIPQGIAVFFPSYSMLDHFTSLIGENTFIKKIFYEKIGDPSCLLDKYASSLEDVNNTIGSIIFSVMGGRLSEGINFKDGLARAVIVVGMPFPNIGDPETMLRSKLGPKSYLEIETMKVVNQTIGRAIRHCNDYAIILLIDRRYCEGRIQSMLPQWLEKSLSIGSGGCGDYKFSKQYPLIRSFFKNFKQ